MINRYSSQKLSPLADEQIRNMAPSVFACQPVEGVSGKYAFLPTSQIVMRMRENGWLPVAVDQQRVRLETRQGFQKHIIRFQLASQIGQMFEYRPEICLVNSHDCSSAYQLHAGLYRFICGNGMIVSDSTFEHISIRHTGFDPDQVIEASFKVVESIPKLTESVESFRARKLTPAEQKAFAESAIILKYDDLQSAPIGPDRLLQPRRNEDAGSDCWSVLNRVQELLIRGGIKDYSRRKENGKWFPKTRPVTGIDENVKLNKALWHLAEVLKTGVNPALS